LRKGGEHAGCVRHGGAGAGDWDIERERTELNIVQRHPVCIRHRNLDPRDIIVGRPESHELPFRRMGKHQLKAAEDLIRRPKR
jgi:hypothetical protein